MGVTEQTLPERAAMAGRRGSRVRSAWRRLAESCVCWPALTCIAVGVDWWTSRLIRPDSGRPRVCVRWVKAVTGAWRRLPCVWQRQTNKEFNGPFSARRLEELWSRSLSPQIPKRRNPVLIPCQAEK